MFTGTLYLKTAGGRSKKKAFPAGLEKLYIIFR